MLRTNKRTLGNMRRAARILGDGPGRPCIWPGPIDYYKNSGELAVGINHEYFKGKMMTPPKFGGILICDTDRLAEWSSLDFPYESSSPFMEPIFIPIKDLSPNTFLKPQSIKWLNSSELAVITDSAHVFLVRPYDKEPCDRVRLIGQAWIPSGYQSDDSDDNKTSKYRHRVYCDKPSNHLSILYDYNEHVNSGLNDIFDIEWKGNEGTFSTVGVEGVKLWSVDTENKCLFNHLTKPTIPQPGWWTTKMRWRRQGDDWFTSYDEIRMGNSRLFGHDKYLLKTRSVSEPNRGFNMKLDVPYDEAINDFHWSPCGNNLACAWDRDFKVFRATNKWCVTPREIKFAKITNEEWVMCQNNFMRITAMTWGVNNDLFVGHAIGPSEGYLSRWEFNDTGMGQIHLSDFLYISDGFPVRLVPKEGLFSNDGVLCQLNTGDIDDYSVYF